MSQPSDPRGSISTSQRPWGGFEQFTLNEPTTVKIITVQPGQRLSLQTHEQRGELWQVLDGTFEITLDDEVFPAAKDDRIWVARGARHRMHNTGETPARILEIAYGTFDEDDIVRIEETRPLSKDKHFRLVDIIEKAR